MRVREAISSSRAALHARHLEVVAAGTCDLARGCSLPCLGGASGGRVREPVLRAAVGGVPVPGARVTCVPCVPVCERRH